MNRKVLSILFVLILPTIVLGQKRINNDSLFVAIDSLRLLHDVPSVSIAIISEGEVLWAKGFGIKNVQLSDSVDSNTQYQGASISKTVTALGVISLVQSGRIGLYQNVNEQLESWKIPSDEQDSIITPFHLASHTSGLNSVLFYGYKANKAVPSLLEVLNGERPAKSSAIKRKENVGFNYKYSGSGYCVLQQLVEDKMKESFSSALDELIFSKIEMNHSSFTIPTNIECIAQAHYKGKPLQNGYQAYPELGAAGLWTTPTDLANLLRKLGQCYNQESDFIRSDLLEIMFSPTRTKDGNINNYGLGLMIDKQINGLHIGHTGSTAGYRCFMKYNVNQNYGLVIMTNSANGIALIDNLIEYLANYYEWKNFNGSF